MKYDDALVFLTLPSMIILSFELYCQGKKLMVIGTTSVVGFLDSIGICDALSVTYNVPTLKAEDAKKVSNLLLFLSLLGVISLSSFWPIVEGDIEAPRL